MIFFINRILIFVGVVPAMEKCRQRLGNQQQQFQSNSLIYSMFKAIGASRKALGYYLP